MADIITAGQLSNNVTSVGSVEAAAAINNATGWTNSATSKLESGVVEAAAATTELFRVTIPVGGAMAFEGIFLCTDGSANARWFHYRGGYVNTAGTITSIGSVAANNGDTGAPANTWSITFTTSGNDLIFSGAPGASTVQFNYHIEVAISPV